MRRPWIWILPLALAGAACLRLAGRLGPALALLFLAWALDLAVAWARPGLPMYRRHLLLFLGLALLAGLHGPGPLAWAGRALAAALGLGLACWPALASRRLAGLGWVRGRAERPRPNAPLILVADPHWSTELTNLRATQAAHPEADWLFLGDVFDVWVGIPGMASPLQTEFLAWVDQCRSQGRWVGLWLGNREYFLDSLAGHFDLIGEGIGGGLPGEGLAWEHGDLINAADWRYRLWNLISRSGGMWLFARCLPGPAARALASWLQRSLHTTNLAYKLKFPRAAFRAAAAEQPAAVFLTGHFHTHEVEGNGIALPWAHEGQFMVWSDKSIKPIATT
jgi:UDP-2,3-diacylglucosamine pyrophosphatase LpxH